jgi:outer membrane protein
MDHETIFKFLFLSIMNRFILFLMILIVCWQKIWCQESLLLSLSQAENLAICNSHKINASLHRLEQGYYGYQSSKNYFLPNLELASNVDITKDQKRYIDGMLTLTQPLFDRVAFYSLKEAQIQWEQLRLEIQQQFSDILFQVREAYYRIILKQAHRDVDQMVIEIWQAELKRQQRHLELGSSIPYEVNQTQMHLKNAWIDFYATQKEIKTNQIELLTLLALPPDTSFTLLENDIPLPPFDWQAKDLDRWKALAFQYRPELKQEQFAFLLSQNRIKQTKAENFPTITLYANAGHQYYNEYIDSRPYTGVGVNLDWMLYNPSNKQRIKQAQEGCREAASNYYQIELETTAEIYKLLNESEQSYQAYLTAQEGASLAEEGMQMANKKHELGAISAFEYRDAIKILHEAKQQVNQAKFDLRIIYDRLVQHTGLDLAR